MNDLPAYGHWQLVIFYSLFILVFAFSFFKPKTRRDWRTFGAFSAFVIALFTEMYGFPLTIYLLSGWLSSRFPDIDWFSHDASHLLQSLLGWRGDAHLSPLHIVSNVLILGGLILLSTAWKVLYNAQSNGVIGLARREEQTALARFGEMYARYAEITPRFFPKIHFSTFALK
jgi:protein-S-isoprenylcysteine O-methyltransferase Ste14